MYSLFTFFNKFRISVVVSGSKADVASSHIRISGDVPSALAMPTRCFCHRVAVMEKGKVIEEGKLFDVFTQPKTKTTQNFVRSVINDHLPESVLAKIQNGGQIYRLTFTGEETGQPVLSYIAKNYNVDVNVLYGNIK